MGTVLDASGGFAGCTATDYTLAEITRLLQGWVDGANASSTWVYIVERGGASAGLLVGSTRDSPVVDDGGGERRRRAAESGSAAAASIAALLGLHPLVTSQHSSTTSYQVSYHIR